LFGFCTTRPYISIYTYPTCIHRCAYPSATEPRRLAYPNSFPNCRRRTVVKASPAMYTSGAVARVRGGLVVSLCRPPNSSARHAGVAVHSLARRRNHSRMFPSTRINVEPSPWSWPAASIGSPHRVTAGQRCRHQELRLVEPVQRYSMPTMRRP
jgi:hypothetical protein